MKPNKTVRRCEEKRIGQEEQQRRESQQRQRSVVADLHAIATPAHYYIHIKFNLNKKTNKNVTLSTIYSIETKTYLVKNVPL